jgi:hypothetical protein
MRPLTNKVAELSHQKRKKIEGRSYFHGLNLIWVQLQRSRNTRGRSVKEGDRKRSRVNEILIG